MQPSNVIPSAAPAFKSRNQLHMSVNFKVHSRKALFVIEPVITPSLIDAFIVLVRPGPWLNPMCHNVHYWFIPAACNKTTSPTFSLFWRIL